MKNKLYSFRQLAIWLVLLLAYTQCKSHTTINEEIIEKTREGNGQDDSVCESMTNDLENSQNEVIEIEKLKETPTATPNFKQLAIGKEKLNVATLQVAAHPQKSHLAKNIKKAPKRKEINFSMVKTISKKEKFETSLDPLENLSNFTTHSLEMVLSFLCSKAMYGLKCANKSFYKHITSSAEANFNLGRKYMFGEDVAKNPAEAYKWYKKAANRGYIKAQYMLAYMNYCGDGIEKNLVKAYQKCKKISNTGHTEVEYMLGDMYYHGKGVEKNIAEAYKWYETAANKGHTEAEYMLGDMCYYGESVGRNFAEAYKWYKKAANNGYIKANYNLARMYQLGEGVKKNLVKAYQWNNKDTSGKM